MKGISFKFGGIFLLFLIISLFNYFTITHFRNLEKSDASLVDASGRNRMLSQRIGLYAEMVVKGDVDKREVLKKVLDLHDITLNSLKFGGFVPGISEEEALPKASDRIMPVLLTAEQLWTEYKKNAELILTEDLFSIKTDSMGLEIGRELYPNVERAIIFLEGNCTDMLTYNNALVQAYVIESKAKQEKTNYILLGFLFLNVLIIMIGLYFVRKGLIKPIKEIIEVTNEILNGRLDKKTECRSENEIGRIASTINVLLDKLQDTVRFINELGKGNFDTTLDVSDKNDILGNALNSMRNGFKNSAQEEEERKLEEEKRNWAINGLAEFGEHIRKDYKDTHDLAHAIISYLVKYLEANQGGLFILSTNEEEEQYLELSGMYAFNRQKFVDKKLHKGEGLVGQVWLEATTVYMTDIPQQYINITSGLGDANPNCLLIVPLKYNDDVLGVVEIASFKELEKHKIEFVEQIGESIGSTLSAIRVKSRTSQLLIESQQQSETLSQQEEEMRQNMEEMQATQEEMHRNDKARMEEIKKLESIIELKDNEVQQSATKITELENKLKEIE